MHPARDMYTYVLVPILYACFSKLQGLNSLNEKVKLYVLIGRTSRDRSKRADVSHETKLVSLLIYIPRTHTSYKVLVDRVCVSLPFVLVILN